MMQLMLRTPSDESKMIDEHLTYVNEVKSVFLNKKAEVDNELLVIQESKKRKDFDKRKVERDLKKMLSSKRYAREQHRNIERDLKRLEQEEAMALDTVAKVDNVVNLYEDLGKRIDPYPTTVKHSTR